MASCHTPTVQRLYRTHLGLALTLLSPRMPGSLQPMPLILNALAALQFTLDLDSILRYNAPSLVVRLLPGPCSCSQQRRRGPRACQAPRSLDLPRDWEFWKMAKSGMLSLESLPLHHAGNLPRALIFPVNCFRFTHFRKNASANPFVSHSFKTKDLKPFRFIHFQKKEGGPPFTRSPTHATAYRIPPRSGRMPAPLAKG